MSLSERVRAAEVDRLWKDRVVMESWAGVLSRTQDALKQREAELNLRAKDLDRREAALTAWEAELNAREKD